MWVQIHDLQSSFRTKKAVLEAGRFIGEYLESDPNNFTCVWREYFRVRVRINVSLPLKRRVKFRRRGNDSYFYANFKYEKVPTFCFICGVLGHSEKFCPRLYDTPEDRIVKPYGLFMKAASKRQNFLTASSWLRSGKTTTLVETEEPEDEAININAPAQFVPEPAKHHNSRDSNPSSSVNEGTAVILKENEMRFSSDLDIVISEGKRKRLDTLSNGLINKDSGPVDSSGFVSLINTTNAEGISKNESKMGAVVGRVKSKLGFESCFAVDPIGRSGGLAFFWKVSEEARLIGYSQNHVDFEISVLGTITWRLTGFYGKPNRTLRARTWTLLRTLLSKSPLPWCIIGDINNIVNQSEKRGGRAYPTALIAGFQSELHECSLHDLELRGYPYTWERGRDSGHLVEIILDRALVSQSWLDVFHEIKLCSSQLESWGKGLTGNFKKCIAKCKDKMADLKHSGLDNCYQEYATEKNNYFEILAQQEFYWKQRSKQYWLNAGDKNSKYFHATASSRKRSNQIYQLQKPNGDWSSWDTGLSDVISNYFDDLFTANGTFHNVVANDIRCSIDEDQNNLLLQPISTDEVRHALFQMHPDKAPGPDGMGPGFYQKHWDVVGPDIVNMVTDFFATGMISSGLNVTNLVLIPKKKNFISMSDMRPIALCNVLYKVLSKVLANRMRSIIDQIIFVNQSAFIPGRLISGNVMISFEVMHYLKRKTKGKKGFMALKLDMSKAYDRVEWNYLHAVMSHMGFHSKWIDLVMACITSVSYNVIHGGHVIGPIIPSRGIRQGDPLSTYLFIMCAEGLTALINKFEANQVIQGCKVARGAPSITHMLFADDSYLFCQATPEAALSVNTLLQTFQQASGQQVNFSKSSVFFSPNTTAQSRSGICSVLRMIEASEGSLYLGLPNIIGRNKNSILGFLKNKVLARINSWDGKFLSRAGKEILLKTVIQSLPTHAMSVFLIPLGICEDIEKIMASFWWKTTSSKGRGITWMSWERMAKPKLEVVWVSESFMTLILQCLLNKVGDFCVNLTLWWDNFVWRSVWAAQSVVRLGAVRIIGNGETTRILSTPWLPDTRNRLVTSTHPALLHNTVSSLFSLGTRTWDSEVVEDLFNNRDASLILGLLLSPNSDTDFWSWSGDQSGLFFVKTAYFLLQKNKPQLTGADNSGFWCKMWHLKIPPKVKNLLWRAITDCLPTCLQLVTKHVNISGLCPVCTNQAESIVHALLTCPFDMSCWHTLGITYDTNHPYSFGGWFEKVLMALDEDIVSRAAMLCWAIWNACNLVVWKNKTSSQVEVIASAQTTVDHWRNAQDNISLSSLFFENRGDGAERWTKPEPNKIKINVDAALFPQDNSYGFGIVARDSSGGLIEAKTWYSGGVYDAEVVEAMGVKEALSWIKSNNWSDVEIETDSMLTVQGIRSNHSLNSIFGLIIHDCQILLSSLNNVRICFIRRSANRFAHVVARHSRFLSGRSIFEYNAWDELISLLYSEC
ncbi:uncharacterized protein LOC133032039 [Cannabis sativa]|uniref:uncharacterized protein LOC133032039 n=1 Tax=Cannabis sativa TaxID=3483 RepID=UPI0029C9EEF4|nr:uncharacterized protein LOC133032039 [Cannabis sativa]